jgi:predicted RNase H-like HicB family nuclease
MADEVLKASDAARYLGITRQRIYELAATGRLGHRVAGYWVFTTAELDGYRVERGSNSGGRPRKASAGAPQAEAVPPTTPVDAYVAAVLRYAMVQQLPSGSYIGESLDFPGLIARGATRAECALALAERINAAVAAARAAGQSLPEIDGLTLGPE